MSINKLAKDLNSVAKFFSLCCEFKDLHLRKMIGNAKEKEGLYYLLETSSVKKQALTLGSEYFSTFNKILLWHNNLGQPSVSHLRTLFPYFQIKL